MISILSRLCAAESIVAVGIRPGPDRTACRTDRRTDDSPDDDSVADDSPVAGTDGSTDTLADAGADTGPNDIDTFVVALVHADAAPFVHADADADHPRSHHDG